MAENGPQNVCGQQRSVVSFRIFVTVFLARGTLNANAIFHIFISHRQLGCCGILTPVMVSRFQFGYSEVGFKILQIGAAYIGIFLPQLGSNAPIWV